MHSGVLESGLYVIEEVLGLEHFGMAPEQPAQEVFSGAARTNADFSERRLERFVVAEAASTERLLDRMMEVVALELRDPSGAVPHTRASRRISPSPTPAPKSTGMSLRRRRSSSRTYSSRAGRGSPNAT